MSNLGKFSTGFRGVKICYQDGADYLLELHFPSIAAASRYFGISRALINQGLRDPDYLIELYGKTYIARDLSSEEYNKLIERQQEDARQRAKCGRVGRG